MAASATFALKAGVCIRRARLLMVSPDSQANLARRQAETPLIALYRFPGPALSGDSHRRCKIVTKRPTIGCLTRKWVISLLKEIIKLTLRFGSKGGHSGSTLRIHR